MLTLTKLPAEIILSIGDWLICTRPPPPSWAYPRSVKRKEHRRAACAQEKKDFGNLRLVCRYFGQILLPRQFDKFELPFHELPYLGPSEVIVHEAVYVPTEGFTDLEDWEEEVMFNVKKPDPDWYLRNFITDGRMKTAREAVHRLTISYRQYSRDYAGAAPDPTEKTMTSLLEGLPNLKEVTIGAEYDHSFNPKLKILLDVLKVGLKGRPLHFRLLPTGWTNILPIAESIPVVETKTLEVCFANSFWDKLHEDVATVVSRLKNLEVIRAESTGFSLDALLYTVKKMHGDTAADGMFEKLKVLSLDYTPNTKNGGVEPPVIRQEDTVRRLKNLEEFEYLTGYPSVTSQSNNVYYPAYPRREVVWAYFMKTGVRLRKIRVAFYAERLGDYLASPLASNMTVLQLHFEPKSLCTDDERYEGSPWEDLASLFVNKVIPNVSKTLVDYAFALPGGTNPTAKDGFSMWNNDDESEDGDGSPAKDVRTLYMKRVRSTSLFEFPPGTSFPSLRKFFGCFALGDEESPPAPDCLVKACKMFPVADRFQFKAYVKAWDIDEDDEDDLGVYEERQALYRQMLSGMSKLGKLEGRNRSGKMRVSTIIYRPEPYNEIHEQDYIFNNTEVRRVRSRFSTAQDGDNWAVHSDRFRDGLLYL